MNDDLSGVHANADGDIPSGPLIEFIDGGSHRDRRAACLNRMILSRDRSSKERHNSVAKRLVHEAIVTMDRIHQTFEDRTENLERFLRIELIDQGRRIADIRKNDRNVFALAQHCTTGTQDAFGKIGGDVRL